MHAKYAGKWYKTLTFEQKTTNFLPDGKTDVATWYEAMKVPGYLRIDFAPTEKGDGILFADGKMFSFKDGVTKGGRNFVHPLMVVGFDVYGQPAQTTIEQVRKMGIDLEKIHVEKWQGRDVYVLGADKGDVRSPQLWVDKKRLVFVRLIQLTGKEKKNVSETQFNKYVKAGGGWVAAEVLFFVDGKHTTSEEYTRIKADANLSTDLWDPEKWMSVDKDYWK
ncbi:MAG: hypothetical protein UZ17_ACD001002735 [Acidobacteria bacterium OLB17]|nr:MAG: hypothetical protein UZ17_ACD001002735 [Acidobacteria bacterium OLB17]